MKKSTPKKTIAWLTGIFAVMLLVPFTFGGRPHVPWAIFSAMVALFLGGAVTGNLKPAGSSRKSGKTEFEEPSVNINGLPMLGGMDCHGNMYGSTSDD